MRNFERAGVPRSAAMKLVGHKTEAIYRYAIADESMLREAAAKLAALHDAQREALRKVYFAGPLASYDKELTKSARAEGGRPTLRAPQLIGKLRKEMVGRDGIEPPTPGFSVLAVNPRIVRHFIELCFTARGASSRHVAVGCSLEQSVSDNLGDSHRVPAIARSKMTTPGSGCRHRHARDGLRFQPTARTRATRPSLVS